MNLQRLDDDFRAFITARAHFATRKLDAQKKRVVGVGDLLWNSLAGELFGEFLAIDIRLDRHPLTPSGGQIDDRAELRQVQPADHMLTTNKRDEGLVGSATC